MENNYMFKELSLDEKIYINGGTDENEVAYDIGTVIGKGVGYVVKFIKWIF